MSLTLINIDKTLIKPQYDPNNLFTSNVVSAAVGSFYDYHLLFSDPKTLKTGIPCIENNKSPEKWKFFIIYIWCTPLIRVLWLGNHILAHLSNCGWKVYMLMISKIIRVILGSYWVFFKIIRVGEYFV